MNKGRYIVIEGHDGTGKGTQAKLLVTALGKHGIDAQYVHEPGETTIGLVLEGLIKDAAVERSAISNFLMFTINRIELWQQVLRPNLDAGKWVIADRSWISSVAYQGYAEELGVDLVEIETRKYMPPRYMNPDILFGIQLDDDTRSKRVQSRGKQAAAADTFESRNYEFQRKITEGYDVALANTAVRIEGSGTPEEVHANIWSYISPLVREHNTMPTKEG